MTDDDKRLGLDREITRRDQDRLFQFVIENQFI